MAEITKNVFCVLLSVFVKPLSQFIRISLILSPQTCIITTSVGSASPGNQPQLLVLSLDGNTCWQVTPIQEDKFLKRQLLRQVLLYVYACNIFQIV